MQGTPVIAGSNPGCAAVLLHGRWRDPGWVQTNTRWPPSLSLELQRLVEVRLQQAGALQGGETGAREGSAVEVIPV